MPAAIFRERGGVGQGEEPCLAGPWARPAAAGRQRRPLFTPSVYEKRRSLLAPPSSF